MSPSPVSEQDKEGVQQYNASWQALMQLVRKGSSWSGYERNCTFLNMGGRFAGASHVSGLDFSDDGRGMAVTDWDQDGDLDLWLRNRTAPRLRLMLNQSPHEGALHYVAFRLRGTKANRDAIGAVVELQVDGSDLRPVRSVRAGEMFLSQSSKWLHFGLPENAAVKSVKVLWPGGERSTFNHIEAGNRYLLEQGEALAKPVSIQRDVALKTAPLNTETASSARASLVLPAPVQLPITSYFDESGSEKNLPIARKALLLMLWSAGCPHCKRELVQLSRNSGVPDILALCVDGNSEAARNSARALVSETGFSGSWGMIGAETLERVQVLQEALFDITPAFAVPFSLLLRPGNEIVAIYRGPIPMDTVSHDCASAVTAGEAELRNLAPPFPGRWFTKPAEPAFLPTMIARRIQARYPEDALPYLALAAKTSKESEKQQLVAELGLRHYRLATQFLTKGDIEKSDYHFSKALDFAPDNASLHNDFGSALAQRGRLKEGAEHFMEALRLKPDFPLAKKNLTKARELLERSR